MLATLCSNPAATKAATGGTMTTTLSTSVCAERVIHTARHTRQLASTPLAMASPKPTVPFVSAIRNARNPTAPSPAESRPDATTSIAAAAALTKLDT